MMAIKKYKDRNCNSRGEQKSNLTKIEQRGLAKIRKKIQEGDILAVKTDKSGKLTVMKRESYEKLGIEQNKNDRVIDRRELRKIEGKINAQTKFWTMIVNSGKDHNHQDRILKSKISESQNTK